MVCVCMFVGARTTALLGNPLKDGRRTAGCAWAKWNETVSGACSLFCLTRCHACKWLNTVEIVCARNGFIECCWYARAYEYTLMIDCGTLRVGLVGYGAAMLLQERLMLSSDVYNADVCKVLICMCCFRCICRARY